VKSLRRISLSEQTYEALKEQILDQKLEPGARLNIDALTKSLKVSSSPVREALARLEAERLVVLEVYAGYKVAPHPSPEYLAQLLEFRLLVEAHCARAGAMKRNASTVKLLKDLVARMASSRRLGAKYQEYRKRIQADAQFHQAIVDSAGNGVLSEVYATKHAHLLMSRLFINRSDAGRPADPVTSEHRAIVEAYAKGDGAAAERAVISHLTNSGKRLLAAARRS
jgi:DNA-binding GntR family transcriptional regulator